MNFLMRQTEIVQSIQDGAELVARPGRFGNRKEWVLVGKNYSKPIGIDIINLLVSSGVIRIENDRAILVEDF